MIGSRFMCCCKIDSSGLPTIVGSKGLGFSGFVCSITMDYVGFADSSGNIVGDVSPCTKLTDLYEYISNFQCNEYSDGSCSPWVFVGNDSSLFDASSYPVVSYGI